MWDRINKFINSKTVLSVVVLSVLFIFLVTVIGILVLNMTPPLRLALFTFGQLMLSATVIWLMRKLEVFAISDFSFKGITKDILLAWFGIVYLIVSFFMSFSQVPQNGFIEPNIPYLLIVILHPLIGTAIFEEVLYRGLVLKLLLRKQSDSKNSIIKACIISSVIFGFLHITNFYAGDSVMEVTTKIVTATTAGLFFAAVFVRTRKLSLTILFHGLLNLSSQIFNALVSPDITVQSPEAKVEIANILGFIINILFVTLPILIAALVLLRKVKPDETEENITDQKKQIMTEDSL